MSRFLVKTLSVFLLLVLSLVLSHGAPAAAARGSGSISGIVYFDANMNWERDSGELPAAHQTIELRDQEHNQPVNVTESAADGSYKFSGLSPTETYAVTLLPGDETLCVATADVSDLSGDIDWTAIDLGMIQRGKGVISGTLLDDLNENGAGDPGEPGVPEWGVWVAGSEGAPGVCTVVTTTDANGHFEIAGLPSQVYSFSVEPQETEALWELTFPTKPSPDAKIPNVRVPQELDLRTEGELRGLKIGVHVLNGSAAIAGALFCDYDADQVRGDDESLVECWFTTAFFGLERQVQSVGVLPLFAASISCEDGQFLISGLPAGTYMFGIVPDWCGPGPCFRPLVTLSDGQRSENNDIPFAGCERPPGTTPEPPPMASPLAPGPVATDIAVPGAVTAPSTGSGGAPSGSMVADLAAALAVAGTLAVSCAVLRYRRQTRKEGHHA